MEITIKPINYGIACRIGDTIYVHKDLINYNSGLYSSIITHELQHSNGYSIKDILLDLKANYLDGKRDKYWNFVLSHPSSWIEMLPIWKYDGRLVLNPTILGLWGIFIAFGGIIWTLYG